jgi:cysteine desulfurase/selenocysteine lyase
MLAPFGVGVLYAREELLTQALPFLYGGDMIAEGRVRHDQVEYADLPWKYAAGTPNILGSIVSAQALRLVLDLALPEQRGAWFGTSRPVEPAAVAAAMERIGAHTRRLTARALTGLQEVDGLTVLGPLEAGERSPLVAFTVRGVHPLALAAELDALGVESRAGCHCAALAHRELALDPPASCRLSFALYTSDDDVDRAVAAVHLAVARLRRP